MKVEEGSKIKFLLQFITVALLFCSLGINLWLKKEIDHVTRELKTCEVREFDFDGLRSKRNIHMELNQNDGNYFVPLYTQLTPKTLKHLCANRYDLPESDKLPNEELLIIPAPESSKSFQKDKHLQREKNRTKNKARRKSKKLRQKKCSLISELSSKDEFGSRLYDIGSAMRSGNSLFITEYSMGYMLFEYDVSEKSENSLKISKNIYTLPMPFVGTDHTVGELPDKTKSFFYQISSTKSILGYNLKTEKIVQKEIADLDENPIFENSNSFIDLEFENGFLYGIYKTKNNTVFTVLKMDPENLEEVDKFEIDVHFEKNLINSFVSCHIFYIVKNEGEMSSIQAVFDLQKKVYIKNFNEISNYDGFWKSYKIPKNLQYDEKSDSLTAFDDGKIYSINVIRNL